MVRSKRVTRDSKDRFFTNNKNWIQGLERYNSLGSFITKANTTLKALKIGKY